MKDNQNVLYKTKVNRSKFYFPPCFILATGIVSTLLIIPLIYFLILYPLHPLSIYAYITLAVVILIDLSVIGPIKFLFTYHRLVIYENGIKINPLLKKKRGGIGEVEFISFKDIDKIELEETQEYSGEKKKKVSMKYLYIYTTDKKKKEFSFLEIKHIKKVKSILEDLL